MSRRCGRWVISWRNCSKAFGRKKFDADSPHCTPVLRQFQNRAQEDGPQRKRNQGRLHDLVTAHRGEIEVFCAHDPIRGR